MRRLLISLSGFYAAVVVAFCAAGVFHDRPDWAHAVKSTAGDARDSVVAWIGDTSTSVQNRVTAWLDDKPSAATPHLRGTTHDTPATKPAPQPTRVAVAKPAPVATPAPAPVQVATAQPAPAPIAPVAAPQPVAPEIIPQPESHAQVAENVSPFRGEIIDRNPPSPQQITRARDRLRASLTEDLYDHFDLFLYVSKADHGPWAQHMFVFAKEDGHLRSLHVWPVSTGREATEQDPHGRTRTTDTPAGYYELDPSRMMRHHVSGQWLRPMPFAMFFNWVRQGSATGLAIHGADGDEVALLGDRASAGCVRLHPQQAEALFNLVREKYRGEVPRFAMDHRKYSTMSNRGDLMRNEQGDLVVADGYRVLVYIDAYGGEELVSSLF